MTVLAPDRELAAAVFDAVERRHLGAGRSAWPTPRIQDYGSWLREHQARRVTSGAARLRCLQEVEERILWRDLVVADAREAGLLDPEGAAVAARRARRVIREYGIPLAAVADTGGEESARLVGWIERFDRRCREIGAVAPEDLQGGFADLPEPVLWLDSPAWRPVARDWLRAHAPPPILAPAVPRRSARLCHAPSPNAELASAAAWMGERLAEEPQFRGWICIPDLASRRDEVADAFDQALAPQRLRLAGADGASRYALAGGTPLAAFPHVAAALELLELSVGPVEFPRFSALLRSPGLQESAADAAAAALLDLELREAAPEELRLRAWAGLAGRCEQRAARPPCTAIKRIAAALESLEAVRGAAPMSRWVAHWMRAFERGPWADRGRWTSAEYQSVERFGELLTALAAADALIGTATAAKAVRVLAAAARDTAFQPQTGIPPLWVTATLGDPWLAYDALWIAGMSADRWPAPVAPVPMVPFELQRRYGVERASARAQFQAAADLEGRWGMRAAQCVFSIADRSEAHAIAPSALLPPGLGALAPTAPRPLWRALFDARPALVPALERDGPAFAADERTRGVATLRAQSRCPFRGFAESRLGCDPLTRPTAGFDARERGILLHAALEHVWRELGGRAALLALTAPALAGLIAAAVDIGLERACARRDPGERWRRRERERTQRLLARWLELEGKRSDFMVDRIEQGAGIARLAGLEFSCRLDRVDRLADGSRVLIDYKTGSASPDWRGERPDNPQLPLYAPLAGERLVAVAYAQVNAASCKFVLESERDGVLSPDQRRSELEGEADFARLMALWTARLERIAAEFRAGRADVEPAPRACDSCSLQALCRIEYAREQIADA